MWLSNYQKRGLKKTLFYFVLILFGTVLNFIAMKYNPFWNLVINTAIVFGANKIKEDI